MTFIYTKRAGHITMPGPYYFYNFEFTSFYMFILLTVRNAPIRWLELLCALLPSLSPQHPEPCLAP